MFILIIIIIILIFLLAFSISGNTTNGISGNTTNGILRNTNCNSSFAIFARGGRGKIKHFNKALTTAKAATAKTATNKNVSFYENIGYVEYTKKIYDNIANHKINLKSLNLEKASDLNKSLSLKTNLSASRDLKATSRDLKATSRKHWTQFESWDKLQKDAIAKKEYLDDKNSVLKNPNLDWSEVTKEMGPKLNELREYIGIINLRKGTNILYVKKYEGSPTTAGDENSETTFASIPSNLVNKYSNMVGLFMFHTHPADIRGSPLPSSYDLSAALYFGSISRFAASVIISRYGVLVYGLSQQGHKFLTKTKDYNLAVLNLSFDIIAAHESIRSWTNWKLDDYVKFYERYKMFLYIFPTSEYIADNIKDVNECNVINPISYELIIEHYDDINNYLNK